MPNNTILVTSTWTKIFEYPIPNFLILYMEELSDQQCKASLQITKSGNATEGITYHTTYTSRGISDLPEKLPCTFMFERVGNREYELRMDNNLYLEIRVISGGDMNMFFDSVYKNDIVTSSHYLNLVSEPDNDIDISNIYPGTQIPFTSANLISNWQFTSGATSIIVPITGLYHISYQGNVKWNNKNSIISLGLFVNSQVIEKSQITETSTTGNDVKTLMTSFLINLTVGDQIAFNCITNANSQKLTRTINQSLFSSGTTINKSPLFSINICRIA